MIIENELRELKEYRDTGLTPQEIKDGKLLTRWIPVDEKLPQTDKYILMSFLNYSLPCIGRYEVDQDGNGNFYVGDDGKSCVEYDLFVVAWMPMPLSYYGGEIHERKI